MASVRQFIKHMGETGAAAIIHRAGQHGASGDKDGGNVHPGGSHEQAGHVLVAVGDHHQPVKLVGHRHGLSGVGDQVPGDQGIFHPHMTHGDAVAHGDGGELHGGAAGRPDASLNGLGDLIQVHVAGDDLIIRADHADEGALQLLPGVAQGIEQRAVGGGGSPFFYNIRTHRADLLKIRILCHIL